MSHCAECEKEYQQRLATVWGYVARPLGNTDLCELRWLRQRYGGNGHPVQEMDVPVRIVVRAGEDRYAKYQDLAGCVVIIDQEDLFEWEYAAIFGRGCTEDNEGGHEGDHWRTGCATVSAAGSTSTPQDSA